jgi:hypothetical protein
MENTKQRALLYVAARFMMVRIDLCAKRKRARAQGRKVTSSKRSSSDKVTGSREGGPARPQATSSRISDPGTRLSPPLPI